MVVTPAGQPVTARAATAHIVLRVNISERFVPATARTDNDVSSTAGEHGKHHGARCESNGAASPSSHRR